MQARRAQGRARASHRNRGRAIPSSLALGSPHALAASGRASDTDSSVQEARLLDRGYQSEENGVGGLEAHSHQSATLADVCARVVEVVRWARAVGVFWGRTALHGTQPTYKSRSWRVTGLGEPGFVRNVVRNQKYTLLTFVPAVLVEQFRFFFNLYFLVVALSQFYKPLQIGFLFTYVAPLVFVLGVTMAQEAVDDVKRWRRDCEVNAVRYERLDESGHLRTVKAADIRVGHVLRLHPNERVPADVILLRCAGDQGTTFIRTDQLDGETDWKLRRPLAATQQLELTIAAAAPVRPIDRFEGTLTSLAHRSHVRDEEQPDDEDGIDGGSRAVRESIGVDNTMWANTVVAGGSALGIVVYTGSETRAGMNTNEPPTKVGKTDAELNTFTKLLFVQTVILSVVLISLKGYQGLWYIYLFRFVLLFSSIIPISLKVNMDLAKVVYAQQIMRDPSMHGAVVRTTSIPEETGRITYLFSDKTGTLTQNEMVFKRLHTGRMHMSVDAMSDISRLLTLAYSQPFASGPHKGKEGARGGGEGAGRAVSGALAVEDAGRAREVRIAVEALALCHSVTPVMDEGVKTYQAASPDEIALVGFAEKLGLSLEGRSQTDIVLQSPNGQSETWRILYEFPFTSARKRMGIVVQRTNVDDAPIVFLCKGADSVMGKIVEETDWLDEECDNLSREGLRTLVVGRRVLSPVVFARFEEQYEAARLSLVDRDALMMEAVGTLEDGLETLAVTGVEDKLQRDVRSTLESLRNAGIRIWMLTGDKVETATCVALSSKLVARPKDIVTIQSHDTAEISRGLNRLRGQPSSSLVIDGEALRLCLDNFRGEFLDLSGKCPAVAEVVELVKEHTRMRVAAIGDGGNDVAMIQAAHVGVGIVGKEGKQASLAADFSLNGFRDVNRLLLWHGRNSYKRTCTLSQFVIHRGLVISVLQAVFSAFFYFAPIPIYTGWLMVGYATVYTALPVFTLVLDEDVSAETALVYPELYKELVRGRSLSTFTFLRWQMQSVFQGGMIMIMAIVLFENSFVNVVAITFTALILTELLNVAAEIRRWQTAMVWAQVVSVLTYVLSIFALTGYFDVYFFATSQFWWKVVVIVTINMVPVVLMKRINRALRPPAYAKLG